MFPQSFRDLLQSVCQLEMPEQKKILDETIISWKGKQEHFSNIEDPREQHKIKYKLIDILILTVIAR